MLRRTVIALSVLALLGGSAAAYAQSTQPTPRAHGMARMQKRFNLTDDQVKAIQAAYERHRDERKQAWQALGKAQSELRTLALNGGDANAIAAKTSEVQQLLGQTVTTRVKLLQEIGPVLTPEQRAKFAQARFGPGMHRHEKAPTQS